MQSEVIFSHDGNLDDLICLCVLLSAHKKGVIKLRGVILTPADSYLEPALFATRKIMDIMECTDIKLSVYNGNGTNPFPDEWRGFPYPVCHMPFMLRNGKPKYPVSNVSGENIILEIVKETELDSSIILVETGPLSCISRFVDISSNEDKKKIKNIIWMGGAIDVAGSIETFTKHDGTAEWNAYWEPAATKNVFESGLPIIMCPLDTTNSVPITTDFLRRLAENTNNSFLGDMVVHIYSIICRNFGVQNYYAWDILTVSYLLNSSIFEVKDAKISVYKDGQSQGRTYRDENSGNLVKYMSSVNVAEWEKTLIKYLM